MYPSLDSYHLFVVGAFKILLSSSSYQSYFMISCGISQMNMLAWSPIFIQLLAHPTCGPAPAFVFTLVVFWSLSNVHTASPVQMGQNSPADPTPPVMDRPQDALWHVLLMKSAPTSPSLFFLPSFLFFLPLHLTPALPLITLRGSLVDPRPHSLECRQLCASGLSPLMNVLSCLHHKGHNMFSSFYTWACGLSRVSRCHQPLALACYLEVITEQLYKDE